MSRKARIALLLTVAFACIAGVFAFVGPVPQDPAYHDFADKRPWAGIPNFGDVAGNAAFIMAGIAGLLQAWRSRAGMLWWVFFGGVLATGFGSGYYHLAPDSERLVWDRLPMTVAFMSLFAVLVAERIDRRAGMILAAPFLCIGVCSVVYWVLTDDLRPYALVQFLPPVLILMMLRFFPAKHEGTKYLFYTFGFYLLAKVLEHDDAQVFAFTDGMLSGHTLKHVCAAAGAACMIGYMRKVIRAYSIDTICI